MSEICPKCGQVIRKKPWKPPALEEVKAYQKECPELRSVDAYLFWKGFNDGGWVDTQGKPVRNWKLKMRTWASYRDPVKPKYEPPKRTYAPPAPIPVVTDEQKAAIKAASKAFAPKPELPPIDVEARKAELLKRLYERT
jgi:hypothetical protein